MANIIIKTTYNFFPFSWLKITNVFYTTQYSQKFYVMSCPKIYILQYIIFYSISISVFYILYHVQTSGDGFVPTKTQCNLLLHDLKTFISIIEKIALYWKTSYQVGLPQTWNRLLFNAKVWVSTINVNLRFAFIRWHDLLNYKSKILQSRVSGEKVSRSCLEPYIFHESFQKILWSHFWAKRTIQFLTYKTK